MYKVKHNITDDTFTISIIETLLGKLTGQKDTVEYLYRFQKINPQEIKKAILALEILGHNVIEFNGKKEFVVSYYEE